MGKVVKQHWEAALDAGLPRRARQPCTYEAYLPDPLMGRPIKLDGDVAAEVADAESAIIQLNASAATLADTEALARLLLRAESVASSRIEGLEVGGRRLLLAEAARDLGDEPRDVTATEVLGNIDAMVWSLGTLTGTEAISVAHLLEMHRRLLRGTRMASHAGQVRQVQNWIGGNSYNPCSAEFVPPPPDAVHRLLEDLCDFCNGDSLPAVAQAAVIHAQFETIHPFVDGNGRIGRALIHLVLRRRSLTPRVLPPISLILATRSKEYVDGLRATRYLGAADSPQAHKGLNEWIALFAAACRRAVDDALAFEVRTRALDQAWRAQLGQVRAKSAVDLLIRALPGAPLVTVNGAADLIGRSFQATNAAITRLAEAGILLPVKVGRRRNRAFEASDVLQAFTDLERQLASPAGDTRVSGPARPVPRRRRARGNPG